MTDAPGPGSCNRCRPEPKTRSAGARRLVRLAVVAAVATVVPLGGAALASASALRPALGHGAAKPGTPVAQPAPPPSTTTTTVTTVPAHPHGRPALGH